MNFGGHRTEQGRSHWPRGLRRRSAAARLLKLWVRFPPGAWIFVCCECCVFSGRGLCDELITRPEESYRLWCVVVCDLETSRKRRPWPALGRSATRKTKVFIGCSSGSNSGLGWASRLLWYLPILSCMTSLTQGMLKSVCRVWFATYRRAFAVALRILDWDLCLMTMLDLLTQLHSSTS